MTAVVLGRLAMPDFLQRLADRDDDPGARAAATELATLRLRLEDHYEQAAAGRLSAGGLARVEAALLPRIEAAEEQSVPRTVPAVVRDLAAAADLPGRWRALAVEQRRTVIDTLMTVRVLPAAGRTFDPERVAIEWRR